MFYTFFACNYYLLEKFPQKKRSTWVGRDSKGMFVWGAQGKVVSSLRTSSVPGAYKWSALTSLWAIKNGGGNYALPDADFRAIYSITEDEVLIGASDGNGVFKTEDGGNKWVNTNNGIEETSQKITAITANGQNIFLSIQESNPSAYDGGIYLSDCQSKGYSWVYYSDGMGCSSSYELSAGSTIYTGSTCDGIYALSSVIYLGDPKAYFSFKRNNQWNERDLDFYDRSAGLCTSDCINCPNVQWSWSCDDGFTSSSQNPTHTFSTSGNHSCNLTVQNNLYGYSDTYSTSIYIPEVLPLNAEKVSGNPRLYWSRIAGDETEVYKYKVLRSTDPQGSSIINLITITPPDSTYCNATSCEYTDNSASGNVYYYRIFTQ